MATLQDAAGRPRRVGIPAGAADAAGALGSRLSAGRATQAALLALILLAVVALGVLQVIQTSQVATTGYAIRALERERQAVAAEIRLLEADVAARSNLDLLRQEAIDRLGMVEPETHLRVEAGVPAPGSMPLPRRYVEETAPAPPPTAAWWEQVLRVFPGFE